MRRFPRTAALLCLLCAAIALGCSDESTQLTLAAAPLSGANADPPNTSTANGAARIEVDTNVAQFSVELHAITEVTAAHIHSGAAGSSGPVRVNLFAGPTTGAVDGMLAQGSFGSGDVQGISFDELINEVRGGMAYVDVHTTGFPDGEVRAQLQVVN